MARDLKVSPVTSMLFLMLFYCFWSRVHSYAQDAALQGQLSSWLAGNRSKETNSQLGIRYIPAVTFTKYIRDLNTLDFYCSVKTYAIGYFESLNYVKSEKNISPYRIWFRYSASQYEIRLGLQKINFGSASIFRPLMWFDLIDPRDPLQITDGVYSLLFRYYFMNNSNVWFWILYGNDARKGWEFYPTVKETPELGGRFQFPLFSGETAFSFHHRRVDISDLVPLAVIPLDMDVPENRYAFDGKWDLGVGFWFEGSFYNYYSELIPYNWQRALNIGIDYTFDMGNGLNVLTEYFMLENTKKPFASGEGFKFSALSMNYPLGLLDNIAAMLYYDWKDKKFYRFLSLQRTYDNWNFFLFGFWNPDEYKIYVNSRESNQYAGKGLQLMVVFNH